jgi:hypothetical protein
MKEVGTMTKTPATRTVIIPACDEHWGRKKLTVTLNWICPTCGGPRGEKIFHDALSYDGRYGMTVDGWSNPCGHIDFYGDVRAEWTASQKASAA